MKTHVFKRKLLTGISVGKDPRGGSGGVEREVANGKDKLVKQRDEVNRVGRRAVATLVVIDGVGHVRFVVGRVQVDTVPLR